MIRKKKTGSWKDGVYSSLEELGLDACEIELYTTSAAMGPVSISALARQLKISRPSVYKIIGRLATLGLARLPDPPNSQMKFLVEPPTTILERIRMRKTHCADLDNELSNAMPEALANYNKSARAANIRMFHGRAQLKHLYESVLDYPDGDIRFFGSSETFVGFLTPQEFALRTQKKVRVGAWNRVLLPSTQSRLLGPNPEAFLRDVRVFEASSAFTTIFQLFAGNVVFWWPETLMAMRIEDPSLFKMMESIFSKYWESGIPHHEFFGKDGYPLKGAGQKHAA